MNYEQLVKEKYPDAFCSDHNLDYNVKQFAVWLSDETVANLFATESDAWRDAYERIQRETETDNPSDNCSEI